MSRRVRAVGEVVTLVLVLAACGGESSPTDVPELTSALQRVDEAVVDRDFDAAEDAISELEAATEQAVEDGDIDEPGADRILGAASALTDSLEEMGSNPSGKTPTPEPDDEPTTEAPEPEESDTPAGPQPPEKDDKDEGPPKGKGGGKDNGAKKGKP